MRLLPFFLVIAIVWSCSTTPRVLKEHGYPPSETEPLETGLISYHDNNGSFFSEKGTGTPLDLKARITKDESALDKLLGTQDRKLVQTSSLSWAGHSVIFKWVCEYRLRLNDTSWAYDYKFSFAQTAADIAVEEFQTTGQNLRSALPFEVFRGKVAGVSFRVVGVRDLIWHRETEWSSERGSGQNIWWSFHDPEQKFQVVNENNEVMAELVGLGDSGLGKFAYQVSGTTPQPLLAPIKELLGMVAGLNQFLEAAEQYRNGWSPDVRRFSPAGREDWPLY